MKKFIITLILFFVSFYTVSAQDVLPKISHIEVISDTLKVDSLALINKEDIDIINTVFYQRNKLDSLVIVQDSMLVNLEAISSHKSIIIEQKDFVIEQNAKIRQEMQKMIDNNNKIINQQQQDLKKEKRKKTFWTTTTGICLGAIICLVLI